MNGNFKYTISDADRNRMSVALSGKVTKRMVSRAEIADYLQGSMDAMIQIDMAEVEARVMSATDVPTWTAATVAALLLTVDPEDSERLTGKSPSYITGWNKVKRRKAR